MRNNVPKASCAAVLSAALSCAATPPVGHQASTDDPATSKRCLSSAPTVAYWKSIKSEARTADGNLYAVRLADCLRSPDPVLRDQIAYEVLTYWLRQNVLSAATRAQLTNSLLPWLELGGGAENDDQAIGRAFSALILSELVLADTKNTRLSVAELNTMTKRAAAMVVQERDYRGLDARIGWIHTIAHGSDLLWRLASHPETTPAQHRIILQAIGSQLLGEDTPPFVFNEFDRMARVVSAVAIRAELGTDEVTGWISDVSAPAPLKNWVEAFGSIHGMTRLHNTKHFLRALRQQCAADGLQELVVSVDALLAALP